MAEAGPTAHWVAGVLVAAPHNLSLGSEGIRRDFPCAILDEGQNKKYKKNYVFITFLLHILYTYYSVFPFKDTIAVLQDADIIVIQL